MNKSQERKLWRAASVVLLGFFVAIAFKILNGNGETVDSFIVLFVGAMSYVSHREAKKLSRDSSVGGNGTREDPSDKKTRL